MADMKGQTVWTVVEVWDGLASRVRVFSSLSDAKRTYLNLKRKCKMEDDLKIFEKRVVKPGKVDRRALEAEVLIFTKL